MKPSAKVLVITVVLILIYLLGLVSGLFALCYMSGEWKKGDLEYYASSRIIEYMDYGRIDNWSNGGMAAVIYNADGKFQDFFRMNGDPFSISFVTQTENALPAVLSGETTLNLYPLVRNYSKLRYTSFIYVGMPITQDGEIVGAFFWVKELPDLAATMIGYFVVFTLFFVVLVAFWLYILCLQKRNELIHRSYI
ncbi:MAG: hypothetical protein LUF80_01475, partial [Oscillospiraceae bacterium]|nr:hypothetical protein [Oscillospiraceae bacterium]